MARPTVQASAIPDIDEIRQTIAIPIVDDEGPDEAKSESVVKMFMQQAKTNQAPK